MISHICKQLVVILTLVIHSLMQQICTACLPEICWWEDVIFVQLVICWKSIKILRLIFPPEHQCSLESHRFRCLENEMITSLKVNWGKLEGAVRVSEVSIHNG